jgi:hypothetical protein
MEITENNSILLYIVHSDINENNIYAEFGNWKDAIDYAKRHKDDLTWVDEVIAFIDEDGEITEIYSSETVWTYDEEDDFELEEEINEFDIVFDEDDEEEPQQDPQLKQNWQQHVNKEIDNAIEKILKFKQEEFIIANFYTDEVDKLYDYLQAKKLGADLIKVSDYNKLSSVEQRKIFNKMLTEGSFTIFISTEKDQLLPPIRRVAQVTETITYADPMVDEGIINEGINLKNKEEQDEFFRLCDEIGIYTAKDLINFKKEVGCTDENILQALRDYRAELGPDFKIANPELERELAMKYEGIDFDGLVEELEEHEDMVECKECYDLVTKESCIKSEHGYVCEKCSKSLEEEVTGDVKLYYCFFDGDYVGDVYAKNEDEAYAEMEATWPEYCYSFCDGIATVELADEEGLEEAIKMTRDELLDKEGTTDVELINAGRPEEERVELVELDLRETSVGTPIETKSAVDPKKSDAAAKELKDLVDKKDKKVSIAEIQAILNKYKQ